MKFLIDNQLPISLANFLQGKGCEASHVFDLNMTSASDNDIWNYAANNKYILISKDEDFFHFCKKNPGVVQFIWVRIGNCRTIRLIAAFDKVWSTLNSALQAGENLIEIR